MQQGATFLLCLFANISIATPLLRFLFVASFRRSMHPVAQVAFLSMNSPWLHVLTHQHAEDTVCFCNIFPAVPASGIFDLVHSRFPQLVVIHFTRNLCSAE